MSFHHTRLTSAPCQSPLSPELYSYVEKLTSVQCNLPKTALHSLPHRGDIDPVTLCLVSPFKRKQDRGPVSHSSVVRLAKFSLTPHPSCEVIRTPHLAQCSLGPNDLFGRFAQGNRFNLRDRQTDTGIINRKSPYLMHMNHRANMTGADNAAVHSMRSKKPRF